MQTPRYVRDNIPLSLLAKVHAAFLGGSPAPVTVRRYNPSGYAESPGAFAERVRREAEARLGRPCWLELGAQTEYAEPRFRINTDLCDVAALVWDKA